MNLAWQDWVSCVHNDCYCIPKSSQGLTNHCYLIIMSSHLFPQVNTQPMDNTWKPHWWPSHPYSARLSYHWLLGCLWGDEYRKCICVLPAMLTFHSTCVLDKLCFSLLLYPSLVCSPILLVVGLSKERHYVFAYHSWSCRHGYNSTLSPNCCRPVQSFKWGGNISKRPG